MPAAPGQRPGPLPPSDAGGYSPSAPVGLGVGEELGLAPLVADPAPPYSFSAGSCSASAPSLRLGQGSPPDRPAPPPPAAAARAGSPTPGVGAEAGLSLISEEWPTWLSTLFSDGSSQWRACSPRQASPPQQAQRCAQPPLAASPAALPATPSNAYTSAASPPKLEGAAADLQRRASPGVAGAAPGSPGSPASLLPSRPGTASTPPAPAQRNRDEAAEGDGLGSGWPSCLSLFRGLLSPRSPRPAGQPAPAARESSGSGSSPPCPSPRRFKTGGGVAAGSPGPGAGGGEGAPPPPRASRPAGTPGFLARLGRLSAGGGR